jgi:hypothetical protein
MDLKEIVLESVDWMYLAQDREQSFAVLNTIMKLLVPQNAENIFIG